ERTNTQYFRFQYRTLDTATGSHWQRLLGSVWSAPTSVGADKIFVIKREDGGPGRSVANEHKMHRHIIQILHGDDNNRLRPNIPHCEGFLSHNATAWDQMLPRFPKGYTGCNALVSEKIPPLSRDIRKLLAQKFHPDMDPDEIADSLTNSHCLMETLGLDLQEYAVAMAEALAFLHWSAKVDANDVEFVLANIRKPQASPGEDPSKSSLGPADFHSNAFGSHAMWILDFDCCRTMTLDSNGIKQACRSFWRNDPYYPRPGSDNAKDKELWDVFRAQFLRSSDEILSGEGEDVRRLPQELIECIEETKGRFTKGTDFW
ncbi:hypothetical protein CORC01_13370, partial [Colletotrichum orchidophilum]